MNDLQQLMKQREPEMFGRVGMLESVGFCRCEDIEHAKSCLQSEYFDHALHEAANDGHRWQDIGAPEHLKVSNEQIRAQHAMCKPMLSNRFDRLRALGFDENDLEKVLWTTSLIIVGAWIERTEQMPPDDRNYDQLDKVIGRGHMVCGWVNGLYPDGEWAVW
jgi:hypothetical protein